MAGWVRVYRKSIESQVFQSERLWKVFSWCLLRASHSHRWVSVRTGRGNTEVEIMPGQFIFGRKAANKLLRIPESSITRCMKKLTSIGAIEIKPDTHFSIVTICNWETYQKPRKAKRTPKRTPKEHPTDTQAPPNGHPSATNKNVQEGLRIKENDPPISPPRGTHVYTADFERFWSAYPRRVQKDRAFEAWKKAVPKRKSAAGHGTHAEAKEYIIAAAIEFAGTPKGKGRFCPHPSSWLRAGCYEDDRAEWQRPDDDQPAPKGKDYSPLPKIGDE